MQPTSMLRCVVVMLALIISAAARADVAQVNGIDLFYEEEGRGKPLILLHGGFGDSGMWDIHSFFLRFHYRVIRVDSRGHGRSTDGDGPITYRLMADDVLALMDHLGITNAHFAGWSDGAVIAADIASRRPEKVDQMILFGAAFGGDVYIPIFQGLLDNERLFKDFISLTYRARYESKNPQPQWSVFQDKMYDLWTSPCYLNSMNPGNCLEPLESINAPALVVVGEQEIIRFDHTQAVANAIPGAELKVVALAGHYLAELRPFLATRIIKQFLD